MSLSYNPSDGARPDSFWGPKFLSNRDISGQAPIDKAAFPGIHVTPACHHDGVYSTDAFETCFSNLIAVGFRRLIIDLYWDFDDRAYNLCPVHVPDFNNTAVEEEAVDRSPSNQAGSLPRRSAVVQEADFVKRQTQTASETASPSASSNETTSTNTTATTSSTSAVSTSTGNDGTVLLNLGPFRCSQGLDLESIIDIMADYIGDSSDASAATVQLLVFNLHSARSSQNPTGPPQNVSSDQYPSSLELVGTRWNSELGTVLYDPDDLRADRANLNNSWNQVRVTERLPITGYFTTETLSNGATATEDGWPSELYLLLTRLERILVAWGTVDPQMEGYDFESDSGSVFSSGMLSDSHNLQLAEAGTVTSGCIYRNDEKNVQQINNTWAVMNANNSQDTAHYDLSNMTSCGVSPILNQTLGNESAGDAYRPYQQVTEALVLGWADGEPRNASSPGMDDDSDSDQFRCAVIDSSNDYRGKWRVVSCQGEYRAACRIGGQPYNWRLSRSTTDFTGAPDSCPEGSSFDLPITQLENTYLYEHILDDVTNTSDSSIQRNVWINLNALDSMDCWVTTGPNGTCRYRQNSQEQHNRQVLIPTIGALIILILTVLTILVKCNVNRRNNRRHRIGPGGWEYEGVPS